MALQDKTVLITGGASGIGKTLVRAFAQEGAKVIIADIDDHKGLQTAADVCYTGAEVLYHRTDISDWESVTQLTHTATTKFGTIDVLINNAAMYSTLRKKSFEEIAVEEWHKVLSVNLTGVFLCCKAVVPVMRQAGAGRIINISSSTVISGTPLFLHYVTTKAGVIGFTRSLARELGDQNITVNAVMPGLCATENNTGVGEEYFDAVASARCIKRRQVPEDLLGVLLFLASPASSFITGQSIVVDGGLVMQ